MSEKLKLYGFNNLTKSLSFNIFDICYAETQKDQKEYIEYIDDMYNSDRLITILTNLTQMIGAQILNISQQDYEPQGASVTILIAEKTMVPMGKTHVAHLDKSHVTVHTYPGIIRKPVWQPSWILMCLPAGRLHRFHSGLPYRSF